jgi:hypothetical protein
MTSGAKRSSNARKARRILPSAERRLRASFPEAWAWYELLVSARGAAPLARVEEPEDRAQKTSARR